MATGTLNIMPTKRYSAGEVIFREGDAANGVYLVCDGTVEISKKQGNTDILLARLGEESIFGEMAIIDKKPRSATATALTDVWCYVLNAESFEHKLTQLDPFMSGMFRILVTTVRNMNDRQLS